MIMPYNNIKMEKEEQNQHPQENHPHHENQGQVPNPLNASPTFTVRYNNGVPTLGGTVQLPFDDKAMQYLGLTADIIKESLYPYKNYEAPPQRVVFDQTYVEWKPISIELDNISGEKTFTSVWKFINEFPRNIKVIPVTRVDRQKTTSSTWDQSTALGLSYETTVGVNVGFVAAEVSVGASVSTSWGKSETLQETVAFGTEAAAEIELYPGEGVETVLSLTIGQAKALITYQLRVTGIIKAYFRVGLFPPSRYTAVPEEDFTFPSSRYVKQTLDIDSFGDGTVIVRELEIPAKEK